MTLLEDTQTITQDVIDTMIAEAGAFDVPDEYRQIDQMPVYFKLDEDNLFIDPLGMDASRVEGKIFVYFRESVVFARNQYHAEPDEPKYYRIQTGDFITGVVFNPGRSARLCVSFAGCRVF